MLLEILESTLALELPSQELGRRVTLLGRLRAAPLHTGGRAGGAFGIRQDDAAGAVG